jgi:hypothetical protein
LPGAQGARYSLGAVVEARTGQTRMTTIQQNLDEAKVKAFTQRMVTHLTGASMGLMLEVGRQTGPFETLSVMAPATSSVIAERADLTERYVHEWLRLHHQHPSLHDRFARIRRDRARHRLGPSSRPECCTRPGSRTFSCSSAWIR